MKEVLAYNLPLRYRLFSVDGYDGVCCRPPTTSP